MAEFRLLGSVEVLAAGRSVAAGQPRQRSVLAAMLVDAGRLVTWETLVDRVWGETPPEGARHALYSHIARIRQLLALAAAPDEAPAWLLRRPGGYVLEVDPDRVDIHRFQRLISRAGGPGCAAAERAGLLREALGLWRGEPLAGLSGPWVARVRDGWRQQRLDAVTVWADAELQLGNARAVLGPLIDLVAEFPLVEPLSAMLMRALHATGRGAEALDRYAKTRRRLAEELGADPGPELQGLHQAILRGELDQPVRRNGPVITPARTIAAQQPCDLPPDIDDFTGRDAAVDQVQRLLEAQPATAIVISAIAGKAGVGKSALAVHLAHRLRPRFPDGQLYVNLRGAEAQALDPAEVLAGFLRELGMEGAAIADQLDERVRQYRARLADRRVLVVLDNAADEAQVRPLLPASRGCAALVTSRIHLSGLEAAHPLHLEVLEADQAVRLLAKLAGPARVVAQPDAARQIVRLCGWLPLALRIAGARLASRPQWPLALLVERLTDEHRRLDELAAGDLEVRASFALSYQGRRQVERRLFRLLGLLIAPSFPAWVAASLLDVEPAEAEALLERLVDAQLVEAAGQDQAGTLRYRLHDLLRVFARERLHLEEPASTQAAALDRVLRAYLALAERADAVLEPSGLSRYGSNPGWGRHADHPAAASVEHDSVRWFEAERASLVAAVEQAYDTGRWELCWGLAESLAGYFQDRARWDDWSHTHTMALAAARQSGNRKAEARILGGLGDFHNDRKRLDDAMRRYRQSLVAFREAGDRRGELQCLWSIGGIDAQQGRYGDAIARLQPCLAECRELGWRSGEANVLCELGQLHHYQGRSEEAIACHERSLRLMRALGDRSWEAVILRYLGLIHSTQGHLELAIADLSQSLGLVRASGDRHGEAYVWQSLGAVRHQQGRLDDAIDCLEHSLVLARATGDRIVEAYSLHTLGDVRREQGRLEESASCLEGSLAALRDRGLPRQEARALNSLGKLRAAMGDLAAARAAWRPALAIFRELGTPEAAEVAAWLSRYSR